MKPEFQNLSHVLCKADYLKKYIQDQGYYDALQRIFINPSDTVQYLDIHDFNSIVEYCESHDSENVSASRSIIVNYYTVEGGEFIPVEIPQYAQFAVFSAQVVVDLEALEQEQSTSGKVVQAIIEQSGQQVHDEKEKQLQDMQDAIQWYKKQSEEKIARLEEEIAALKSQK